MIIIFVVLIIIIILISNIYYIDYYDTYIGGTKCIKTTKLDKAQLDVIKRHSSKVKLDNDKFNSLTRNTQSPDDCNCNITNIDKAQFHKSKANIKKGGNADSKIKYVNHSSLDNGFMKLIINNEFIEGGKSTLKCKEKNNRRSAPSMTTHSWYSYKTWDDLKQNNKSWNQYLNDRKYGHENFLFDWTLVLEEIMPIVIKEDVEYIGVIRAKSDSSTLYIHSMESSQSNEQHSDSYIRSVPAELVSKYTKIPGYFLFHTHPITANADPFPSDIDIYIAISHSLDKYYLGEIVIGEYGIIVYYLNDNRFSNIMKNYGLLGFYTFCYDVIMAWNSIHSVERIKLQDRLHMLEKFGITMIIIPSNYYIADNHFREITPSILCDRFIKNKYELLDHIKDMTKREEYKELNKRSKQKHKTLLK